MVKVIKSSKISAGIMKFDDKTKKVSSDKRKGTIEITCNEEGEKMFTWTA